MKLLDVIPTPWTVYAVTFSRDGSRLAVGGGTWYGHGGIMMVDVANTEARLFWCADLLSCDQGFERLPIPTYPLNAPTVSGLCFSDDDRHLAASMWRGCWHYAPAELFRVDGLDVRYLQCAVTRTWRDFRSGFGPCPTGVLLYRDRIITRSARSDSDDVIAIDPLPEHVGIATDQPVQSLTHSGVIVCREAVITEAGGSPGVFERQPDGTYKERVAQEGLVVRAVSGNAPDVVIPVQGGHRITAIARVEGEDAFVTGGGHGEIDAWSWDGRWMQHRIQHRQPPSTGRTNVVGVAYAPDSIVGLVSLSRRVGIASVDAGSRITVYSDKRIDDIWNIPVPGSPRGFAAHPQEPWIAVGLKRGGFTKPASAVAIIEVD